MSGWQAVVARHRSVRLTGQDERGHAVDEVLTGWPPASSSTRPTTCAASCTSIVPSSAPSPRTTT
ncbi:hypothetical protein NKG05_05215 [Oerskovia sp. M15]